MCRAIRALKKKQKHTGGSLSNRHTNGGAPLETEGAGEGVHPNLQSGFVVCFQESAGFFFFCFSFLEETPLMARRFGSPAGSELRRIIRGPTCRQTRITAVRGPPCACLTQQRVPQEEFWRRARLICILAAPVGFFFFLSRPFLPSFLSAFLSAASEANSCLMVMALQRPDIGKRRGVIAARAFRHLCAHTHMHGQCATNERGVYRAR